MDDLESQSGADTMPGIVSRGSPPVVARSTVLGQDVQALLHAQGGVEDDKAVADRQHVIAGPGLEEGADGALRVSASGPGPRSRFSPYQTVQLLAVERGECAWRQDRARLLQQRAR